MSEENKDIQEEQEKASGKNDSGEESRSDAFSAPEDTKGKVEKQEKEESARDLMKDDADELPEDVKKKLEKKKSEKSGKKATSKKVKKKKKKERGKVSSGKVYIKATYNNTIITITDLQGEVISWASAGVAGFKGPKKSTPYAAQIITKIATMKAKQEYGMKEVSVFVKGVGMGRESAIRTLNSQGIFVTSIKDITPIPHNGCRPPKPRRV